MVLMHGAIISLVLLCLQGIVVQARHLHERSPYAGHHERLFQRQTNVEPPRCPPRSTAGKITGLKDDYNVPDASIEQIDKDNLGAYFQFLKGEGAFAQFAGEADSAASVDAEAAAAAESNVTETSAELAKLAKRFGRRQIDVRPGALRHAAAPVKVPTNGADGILYTSGGAMFGDVQNRVISTSDLCGCTVFVVSSPFATLMLHVLERRAFDFSYQGPGSTVGGVSQALMDAEFVAKGRELLMGMLRTFGPTYREWFPLDKTSVAVVAPRANPDYLDWDFWKRREDNPEVPPQNSVFMTEELFRSLGYGEWPAGLIPFWWPLSGTPQNPVSTHPLIAKATNPDRLIYPTAAKMLLESINEIMIPGRPGQSELLTYRRRYNNDPNHRNKIDDREFVAVVPWVTAQGTVGTIMFFDDDQFIVMNRL